MNSRQSLRLTEADANLNLVEDPIRKTREEFARKLAKKEGDGIAIQPRRLYEPPTARKSDVSSVILAVALGVAFAALLFFGASA